MHCGCLQRPPDHLAGRETHQGPLLPYDWGGFPPGRAISAFTFFTLIRSRPSASKFDLSSLRNAPQRQISGYMPLVPSKQTSDILKLLISSSVLIFGLVFVYLQMGCFCHCIQSSNTQLICVDYPSCFLKGWCHLQMTTGSASSDPSDISQSRHAHAT